MRKNTNFKINTQKLLIKIQKKMRTIEGAHHILMYE